MYSYFKKKFQLGMFTIMSVFVGDMTKIGVKDDPDRRVWEEQGETGDVI